MELFTNTLMDNSKQSLKVEAGFEWIRILDYDVKRDNYGLTGWIKWNTDRNKNIQIVSSIHLDQNPTFKKLFRWTIQN